MPSWGREYSGTLREKVLIFILKLKFAVPENRRERAIYVHFSKQGRLF
jgi:hypothetical protein